MGILEGSVVVFACIQALMAIFLGWQGWLTSKATRVQAQVASASFKMNFAGVAIASAEQYRQVAARVGLNQLALKIERRITDFLTIDSASKDAKVKAEAALLALSAVILEAVNTLRDKQQAERNAYGEKGGAEP